MSDAAVFINAAMEPGWLRWQPTFRYGTVVSREGGTGSVALDSAGAVRMFADESGLKLDASTGAVISNVTALFDCSEVIVIGDEVLLMFVGQRWEQPYIVGFRRNPKQCPDGRIGWSQYQGNFYTDPDGFLREYTFDE